ncbi:DUF2892 domain-containing protein [Bacillus carboniphilus]|uniref:DUF2892 domain-containing protein n=1 Tax=Bacillus carboniphilus TaxID=86663 RepID=A0ABY9JS63_9BACI|nr:DUF2892 domain-containing protein [Bacillus carboniphilus]WLR42249.1 DUF2892 domain-containing protein [Bacillus carboniphilus]
MVKPNISILNALMRITCGLSMLSWASSKYTKMPWKDSYLLIMMLGAMKVGEGILRYCPMVHMYNLMTKKTECHSDSSHHYEPQPE